MDARKGKREGEGKNNDWQITETKWRTILQQKMKARPYHRAFLDDKLPCPHEVCEDNAHCYAKDGLDHHYRTIHKYPVTSDDIKKAKSLMVEKHSNETLSCLKKLSVNNKSKVFVNLEY